jgi:hypothetical protein
MNLVARLSKQLMSALQHYSITALQHYSITALQHYSITTIKNFDKLATVMTMGRRQFTWSFCLVCCERQDSSFINVLTRLEYFLSQQTSHCL